MGDNRFDVLIRSFHSRRRVVQTLAGLGARLGLAQTAGAAPKNGSGKSGTNKKGAGKKGAESSFGCTKQINSCTIIDGNTLCPNAPIGSVASCFVNNKGKPLCAGTGVCQTCKRNADCKAMGRSAVCIKKCPTCQEVIEVASLCVVPFKPFMVP